MPLNSFRSLSKVEPYRICDFSLLISNPNLLSYSIPEMTAFAQSRELVLNIISSANDSNDFFSIAIFRAGI
jgi:hypothetical protein